MLCSLHFGGRRRRGRGINTIQCYEAFLPFWRSLFLIGHLLGYYEPLTTSRTIKLVQLQFASPIFLLGNKGLEFPILPLPDVIPNEHCCSSFYFIHSYVSLHLQFPTIIPEMQGFLEMLLTASEEETISWKKPAEHDKAGQGTGIQAENCPTHRLCSFGVISGKYTLGNWQVWVPWFPRFHCFKWNWLICFQSGRTMWSVQERGLISLGLKSFIFKALPYAKAMSWQEIWTLFLIFPPSLSDFVALTFSNFKILSEYFTNCYYCLVTKSCLTFATPWTVPTRFLRPWDFPDKNTGVGCHFLLQAIFLTQGLNLSLLLAGRFLLLSHLESPFHQ